jgi:hypothetical protein
LALNQKVAHELKNPNKKPELPEKSLIPAKNMEVNIKKEYLIKE